MSPLARAARTAAAVFAVVMAASAAIVICIAVAVKAGVLPTAATPAPRPSAPPQPPDLKTVIGNIHAWLFGLLFSLATMFLTYGGVRRMVAGGDPGEVSKAKDALRNAAIGYCLAVLAPTLVKILQGFVGG